MTIKSDVFLSKLGYDYVKYEEQAIVPQFSSKRFIELVPELRNLDDKYLRMVVESRLFEHQLEAYDHLSKGFNVILRSGTGSGKTEAWLLYVLKFKKKTLAIYPTLALANDQLKRISKYSKAIGLETIAIDATRKSRLIKELGVTRLREKLRKSMIVVTNPAFLLYDLKKIATDPGKSVLKGVIAVSYTHLTLPTTERV